MSQIKSKLENGTWILELNRPEKRNAISVDMYRTLQSGLSEAAGNEQVKAALLQGAGDDFSSGNDLSDFSATKSNEFGHAVIGFLKALIAFPKPIVAKVHGHAVGIGTTMLLHCDLVYAEHSTRFSLPFSQLGLVPEAGSSYLLPLLCGHRKASELLLLAEPFGARQAEAFGIVNQVGTFKEIETYTQQSLAKFQELPTAALIKSKALIKAPFQTTLLEQIHIESKAFLECLNSEETSQAIHAFFQRRKMPTKGTS